MTDTKTADPASPGPERPGTDHQALNAQDGIVTFGADQSLRLDCGVDLGPHTVAYATYGTLNEARSNVVLVCHALTGDQYVAGIHRRPAIRAGGH